MIHNSKHPADPTHHNNNFISSGRGTYQRAGSMITSSDFGREADDEESENDSQNHQQQSEITDSAQRNVQSSERRNFVETIVDDILARNHQINQLQLAYNIANSLQSHQQQSNRLSALEENGFRSINPNYIRDTFDLNDRSTRDEVSALIGNHYSGDDAFNASSLYPMLSHNLRAYEPIHASNGIGSDLYNDYDNNDQRQIDEDDDDDDDDGLRDPDAEHYYYEEDQAEESDRNTYRHYGQHQDGLEDEEEGVQEANQEEDEDEDDEMMRQAAEDDYDEDQEVTSQEDIEEDDQQDEEEDSEEYKDEETELERYLRDVNGQARARTAPLKAQKHAEQFKMTPGFSQLEQAAVCAVQLVQRGDMKFDLDSYEGQNSCKKFLGHIEKLCESVETKCQNRSYRKKFSNAYKVLYKEGKLCYLTEILDSAQEAFPYLWVNGEKYVFSKEVIEAGRNLFNNFCKILYQIKDAYQRICEEQSYEALIEIINEVREALEEFDLNWVTYEQLYVIELMLIEQDARRYITDAIEIEKEITSAEVRERAKGKIMVDCPDYNKNRSKLISIINKINAVANPEGKGRDDLQPEILFTAEGLCRRISSSQSKAVRKLAEAIRKTFTNIRNLLRKYEENIEGVDPQLKNNADLVQALVEFEQSWEKGKSYFVNNQKCSQLLHFTSMIEGTAEKYKSFSEQIEDRDTVIFVTIPALLILKNLDEDDKGICKMFFPPMFGDDSTSGTTDNMSKEEKENTHKKYQELQRDYVSMRSKAKNAYDFYNIVEKSVLEMEGEESSRTTTQEMLQENGMCRDDLQRLVQQIRLLSMQLQRYKPAEWNEFLDVALDN